MWGNLFCFTEYVKYARSTWGIQDIAKSRIVLKLVKELEDKDFRVIFQTRAGLDYFKPDIEKQNPTSRCNSDDG